MTQSGKLMPNLDQNSTNLHNLTVLQRVDYFVEEILMTANHVTVYEFNIELNQWIIQLRIFWEIFSGKFRFHIFYTEMLLKKSMAFGFIIHLIVKQWQIFFSVNLKSLKLYLRHQSSKALWSQHQLLHKLPMSLMRHLCSSNAENIENACIAAISDQPPPVFCTCSRSYASIKPRSTCFTNCSVSFRSVSPSHSSIADFG